MLTFNQLRLESIHNLVELGRVDSELALQLGDLCHQVVWDIVHGAWKPAMSAKRHYGIAELQEPQMEIERAQLYLYD